jgi:hypothetical protein
MGNAQYAAFAWYNAFPCVLTEGNRERSLRISTCAAGPTIKVIQFMVLSLMLRTERNIDILLRKVDHIEQMVQEGQMTTSPRYKSTVACQCNGGLDCPNPVLVGVKKASDSTRLFLDTHLALTEAATRGAKIINNNPVWFTEPPEPVSMIHIPLITNPLFENKGRASEYKSIFVYFLT